MAAPYSLYDASVVQIGDALNSLEAVLKFIQDKPQAATIAEARLIEDMLPFAFQVHFACDLAQKMAARLQNKEPAKYENNLKTIDDMLARVAEIKPIVAAVTREAVAARENEIVSVGLGPNTPEARVQAWQYVSGYVTPNVFFHITTAYDIARKEGVQLGKMVFIAPFFGKHMA